MHNSARTIKDRDKRGYVHIIMQEGQDFIGGLCNCDYPACHPIRFRLDYGLSSYLVKGEYAHANPGKLMGAPYVRVVVMHVAIIAGGFATMALSIIWLFAFQNLYGYVYQRIGWIIAIFMGGLVIGCELVNRRSKRLAVLAPSERY